MEGWKEDITAIKTFDELPEATKAYVRKIEETHKCACRRHFSWLDRTQTVIISEKLKNF